MRTTLNLPDDLYESVRSFAVGKRISLEAALVELLGRGLQRAARIDSHRAFRCFSVAPDAAPITLERAIEAEDQP
jgi:hypothetical protein